MSALGKRSYPFDDDVICLDDFPMPERKHVRAGPVPKPFGTKRGSWKFLTSPVDLTQDEEEPIDLTQDEEEPILVDDVEEKRPFTHRNDVYKTYPNMDDYRHHHFEQSPPLGTYCLTFGAVEGMADSIIDDAFMDEDGGRCCALTWSQKDDFELWNYSDFGMWLLRGDELLSCDGFDEDEDVSSANTCMLPQLGDVIAFADVDKVYFIHDFPTPDPETGYVNFLDCIETIPKSCFHEGHIIHTLPEL